MVTLYLSPELIQNSMWYKSKQIKLLLQETPVYPKSKSAIYNLREVKHFILKSGYIVILISYIRLLFLNNNYLTIIFYIYRILINRVYNIILCNIVLHIYIFPHIITCYIHWRCNYG